jgi:ABC-type antimicrobial peptide transport system permease subunit
MPTQIGTLKMVHAKENPERMAAALRSAAALPGILPMVSTFQSVKDRQVNTIRKIVTIVVSLGAIASWLAMVGIFGLLAFTIAQRTREIGVRMALGAHGFDVLRCVLGQYALPFGIGAALGIALAAGAAKVMGNLVFGFIPFDLLSFVAGLFLFGAVAFAASIVPVVRALRIDPATALRYE